MLRCKPRNPYVAQNHTVIHKIGVAGGMKSCAANTRKDQTYFLADVEFVANFKLPNINRKKLESLLHRFFAAVRLDVSLQE